MWGRLGLNCEYKQSSSQPGTCRMCFSLRSISQLCLTLCTPRTAACQAPLYMEFYRQGYWSGLPFLLQGSFLPRPPLAGFLPLSPQRSPASGDAKWLLTGEWTPPRPPLEGTFGPPGSRSPLPSPLQVFFASVRSGGSSQVYFMTLGRTSLLSW